ncbi:A disintegrin and metalloproteinase with thrombospondin motifs 20 [Bulinus truncatus]|nr:A disintegrin and metalloproteinase with thrombospondin motifs 20 [Bulinus truncatus]
MPALSRACQYRPCHQTLEEKYKWIPVSLHTSLTQSVSNIGKKPVVRRACFGTETQCGNWITGVWSQCSVTCGQGRQTRSVACEKIYQNDDDEDDGEDESSPSDDQSLCPADSRPATEQSCNLVTCSDLTDDEISIVTLIHDCQTSRYGCCPDQVTAAVGENQLGCDNDTNQGTPADSHVLNQWFSYPIIRGTLACWLGEGYRLKPRRPHPSDLCSHGAINSSVTVNILKAP